MNFQTIPDILEHNAESYRDDEAVIFGDNRATFGRLWERTNRRANALLKIGIKKGDHVATLSVNSMELLESMLAIWRIGAVFVPMSWRLSPDEIVYAINQSHAVCLVFEGEFQETVRNITPAIKGVKHFCFLGEKCPDGFIDFDAKLQEVSDQSPVIEVRREDMATILYTSGTTGKPKGVMASHGNWISACDALTKSMGDYWLTRPKSLLSGPYFHAGGLANYLMCSFNASPQIVLKKFDPKEMLTLIQKEKVNRLQGVASLYNMILQVPNIEEYDLSSANFIGSGAERIPAETRKRLLEIFPGAMIWEGYGMTESCAIITALIVEETQSKTTSVGKPQGSIELRVVDEQGMDVVPGQAGEIIARGPNMMMGYYNDPQKTAEALRNGWLFTNDLGILDEDGNLTIIERKNNMIKTGGENIYPKEIENVLYQHPQIAEAAVFGLPDETWGESVCAAVVLEKEAVVSATEIISYCKDNLASFKKPKQVFFLEALFRTSSGKVLRSELRKQYMEKKIS
jgi:acyl-CoA synthetase (AMP-forming)/AMP-acid ligase II